MQGNKHMKTIRNIINVPFALFVLACLALSPRAGAQCPQACGAWTTSLGSGALINNTGLYNTAIGDNALGHNTNGFHNTATGHQTLYSNTEGVWNTATGSDALLFNTTGDYNTATGVAALLNNTIGNYNTANGYNALRSNTAGNGNTANGVNALQSNITGNRNTANGYQALLRDTGSDNVGLGFNAGNNLTTGNDNVCIGSGVLGVAGESNTTRIRNVYSSVASGRAVYVTSGDKIGTLVSSRRFKEEIKPMDKASESILALKPVTFRYKKEVDPERAVSFGLIAEDVAKVSPELITRDEKGNPETVRYEAVNAMLLNEFLKEHRQVQEQKTTIAELKSAMTRQQKQIEALTAGLQKVSAQLELSKPALQTVLNNQ
jgi:hypothetical protein